MTLRRYESKHARRVDRLMHALKPYNATITMDTHDQVIVQCPEEHREVVVQILAEYDIVVTLEES